MTKKVVALLLAVLVLGLIAAQCGPAPTPETVTVVETVVVKEEVEKVQQELQQEMKILLNTCLLPAHITISCFFQIKVNVIG